MITSGTAFDEAKRFLILLHGRGAYAEDIMTLKDHFTLNDTHVVAPQAEGNTWYPYGFMAPVQHNEPYLAKSLGMIDDVMKHALSRLQPEKIYICGFSQGACLALEYASRNAMKYGGVIAFTGGLIGQTPDESLYKGDFKGCPVFIGNSDRDPHVPLHRSEYSKKVMESMGASVTLKIYPGMPHTITMEEINWVNDHIFSPVAI